MTDAYVVTSILEFTDRFEGQVFHRGTLDTCEKVYAGLGAIAVSGLEMPIATKLAIVSVGDFDHEPGFRWKMPKSPRLEPTP